MHSAIPRSDAARRDFAECGLFAAVRHAMLALLTALPLAFGGVTTWGWTALVIAACALLVASGIGWCTLGSARITVSPLYVPMVAALLLVVVQCEAGLTSDYIASRESLIKFTGYSIIVFLGVQLFEHLEDCQWRRLGIALTVYVFVLSVFAIVQLFSSPARIFWAVRPRWGGYTFGPYVNHNHYAGLMELLLPVAAVTVLQLPPRHGFKRFGMFAIAAGITSVMLCGSRGGTLSVMVEMAIVLLLMTRGGMCSADPGWPRSEVAGRPFSRRRAAVLAALGVLLVVSFGFAWLDKGHVWKRWEDIARSPELATARRAHIAADSLRMWWSRPAGGFGAGAFETAYSQYQTWAAEIEVDFAHNDYVQLLAETGVIGGLLALAAIVIVLRCGLARLRISAAEGRDWERCLRTGAAIACCGLLVHSVSDFNLHIPANAAWLALLAAWATGRGAFGPQLASF